MSISVETNLLEALDHGLRQEVDHQQNRCAAVAEALGLGLQARRVAALRQAHGQPGQREGGDLVVAARDAVAMGRVALERLDG